MNFGDTVISTIRTAVPAAVATVLLWLGGFGFSVDDATSTAATVAAVGVATTAYHFVVRFLEQRVHPLFGVLLGATSQPEYHKATS